MYHGTKGSAELHRSGRLCKQVPKSEHRAKTASRRPEMGGSGAVLVLRDAVVHVHAALHYYWQRLISARSAGSHSATARRLGRIGGEPVREALVRAVVGIPLRFLDGIDEPRHEGLGRAPSERLPASKCEVRAWGQDREPTARDGRIRGRTRAARCRSTCRAPLLAAPPHLCTISRLSPCGPRPDGSDGSAANPCM